MLVPDMGAVFLKKAYLSLKRFKCCHLRLFKGNFILDAQGIEFQAVSGKYCLVEQQPLLSSSSPYAVSFCFLPAEQLRFSNQAEETLGDGWRSNRVLDVSVRQELDRAILSYSSFV